MTPESRKVVYLDRDGVINKDPGGWTPHSYVERWEDFVFLPGVFEALRTAKERGYEAVIVSNQAGVGKGYFTQAALDEITRKMVAEVRKGGGDIADVFYCTHTNEDGCGCRKPKTGLFERARARYGDGAGTAWYIGDTERDVVAGHAAGLKAALVLSGKASRRDAERWEVRPDAVFDGLLEAITSVTGGDKG